MAIGLIFLKTVSEEYPNCKDEVSTERKIELKTLLLQQLPNVFELLCRKPFLFVFQYNDVDDINCYYENVIIVLKCRDTADRPE